MAEIAGMMISDFFGEFRPVYRRRSGLPSGSCPACAGGGLELA